VKVKEKRPGIQKVVPGGANLFNRGSDPGKLSLTQERKGK
jgi:hypothetical protein